MTLKPIPVKKEGGSLEEVSTQGTGGIVAGAKPFVKTGGVKLFATSATRQLGQLVVGTVKNVVTNVTLFDSFKTLVHVALPQCQPLQNGAVLSHERKNKSFL